jgi:hypothetical protein
MNRYILALLCVVALTLLTGVAAGSIAVLYGNDMPASLSEFQHNLSSLFMTSAGAIIGLLGSKFVDD